MLRRRMGWPAAAREAVRQTPAGRGPGSQLRAGPIRAGLGPGERGRWGLVHGAREQAIPGRAGPGRAAPGRTDPGKPRPRAVCCRARSRPDQLAFRAWGAFPDRRGPRDPRALPGRLGRLIPRGRLVPRGGCLPTDAADVPLVPVRRRHLAPRQRRAGCRHPAPCRHLAWRRHRSRDARAVPRKTFPR